MEIEGRYDDRVYALHDGQRRSESSSLERLNEIGEQVIDVLNPHADPDKILGHSRPDLLLLVQLRVSRRSRGDDARLGVPNVGEMGDELELVYEITTVVRGLDSEREYPAKVVGTEDLFGDFVVRVRGESGVRDPGDLGTLIEPLSECERVLAVALDAEGERLDCERESGLDRRGRASYGPVASRRPSWATCKRRDP